jgi:hypothetical protein
LQSIDETQISILGINSIWKAKAVEHQKVHNFNRPLFFNQTSDLAVNYINYNHIVWVCAQKDPVAIAWLIYLYTILFKLGIFVVEN